MMTQVLILFIVELSESEKLIWHYHQNEVDDGDSVSLVGQYVVEPYPNSLPLIIAPEWDHH